MNGRAEESDDFWEVPFGELSKFSIDKALSGFYWLNPEGKFIQTNKTYQERLGYSENELKEMHIWDIDQKYSKEDRKEFWNKLKQKKTWTFETQYKTKDGETYPVRVTSHYVEFMERKSEFALAQDITERKKTEKKLESFVNAIPDLVVVLDEEGFYEEILTSKHRLLYKPKEELLGKRIDEVMPKDVGKRILDFIKKTIESNEIQKIEYSLNLEGDKHWFEARAQPLQKGEKDSKLVVSVIRDITEQKESIEGEKFLHSLFTHDLKNKMQVIQGYLELIKEDPCKKPNERIEKAIDAVEKTLSLTDKLRKTVSVEKTGIKEVKEEEFQKYIKNAIKNKKPLAKEKDIEINHDIKGIKVLGDSLIEEIVDNLLENAIEHSNSSEVNVSTREGKKEAIIIVEDDGKGIPEDQKKKLFNRDYTEKPSSGGLGLPLIKKIIETYKGKIEIKDSKLGGARFDVTLKKP